MTTKDKQTILFKALICLLLASALLFAAPVIGSKTVSSAGTAEALSATEVKCVWVIVQAKGSNTGQVYVGDSAVSSSNEGAELDALDSVMYPTVDRRSTYDLRNIYVDVDTNGEGVTYTCNRRN